MATIKELAKQEKAKFLRRCPDWNGRAVWQLLFDAPEEIQKIGLPCLAVVRASGARLMDDEETEEYMSDISGSIPEDEETEPEIESVG